MHPLHVELHAESKEHQGKALDVPVIEISSGQTPRPHLLVGSMDGWMDPSIKFDASKNPLCNEFHILFQLSSEEWI